MKLQHLAMAAALGIGAAGNSPTKGSPASEVAEVSKPELWPEYKEIDAVTDSRKELSADVWGAPPASEVTSDVRNTVPRERMANSAGVIRSEGLSPTYATCLSSAHGILDIDACMSEELKHQDVRLNKAYKALLGVLEPASKSALIESERNWVRLKSSDEFLESTLFEDTQAGNAQQLENKLYRVCDRANVLEKYLAFARL